METINNIEDLMRILREKPEWAEAVRNVLLTKALLELPNTLAQFTKETTESFRLVNARLTTMEGDIGQLKEGQAELRTDMNLLKEGQAGLRTDVNELKTDVNLLKEGQAELRTDVNELKTDVNLLKEGQAELQADMTIVKTTQARMGGDLSRMTGQDYESHAARRAPLMLIGLLGAGNAETIATTRRPEQLEAIALNATGDGSITVEKAIELQSADLVVRTESPPGTMVNILAEISITIQQRDLNRALARAATLETATKVRTLPFLIGTKVEEGLDTSGTQVLLIPELP